MQIYHSSGIQMMTVEALARYFNLHLHSRHLRLPACDPSDLANFQTVEDHSPSPGSWNDETVDHHGS